MNECREENGANWLLSKFLGNQLEPGEASCSWIHQQIPLLIYSFKQAQNARLRIINLWERQNLNQIELPVLRTGANMPKLLPTTLKHIVISDMLGSVRTKWLCDVLETC